MKCQACGAPNARRVIDPYKADVEEKEEWVWLCEKDLQETVWSI